MNNQAHPPQRRDPQLRRGVDPNNIIRLEVISTHEHPRWGNLESDGPLARGDYVLAKVVAGTGPIRPGVVFLSVSS